VSTLIPEIQVNDFSKLTTVELKRLQCCEVYDGDEYIFSFTRPGTDFIRARVESAGQLSNSVAGEPLEAIKQIPIEVATNAPTEKRKYKKHKHRVKK
jgi:hypothetical protein